MKKKKIIKAFGILLLILIVLCVLALGYFTIREYRPAVKESVTFSSGSDSLSREDEFTIITYNTGYGCLDSTSDFFFDGGTKVQPDQKTTVLKNLQGISETLADYPADVYFLQEVDLHSKRSFYTNQQEYYEQALGIGSMFAYNFKCDFVPYPLPPIGHVESGVLTLTNLAATSATRFSLPESFSWPLKTCNLKRCMLETRIPIDHSDRELVLLNFHLEAYDSGEGKLAQNKMLVEKLQEEYEKGNYVIAGGDFNQTFENVDEYPILDESYWTPLSFEQSAIPDSFTFAVDDTYPTCRLLNAPYTGSYDTSQVYIIDGFIVSDNLQIETTKVINTNFAHADHQPVQLTVTLK